MKPIIKIGTRESQLAVWQATHVQNLLKQKGFESELIYIKSEGDIDIVTPLYELGVQGIFTKTLDAALLNSRIDIAVHSMKDVPTKLAEGLSLAAVLERASYKDILVFKGERKDVEEELNSTIHDSPFTIHHSPFTIATGSVRRKAQWLKRYPNHRIENLRGNVNTRLRKIEENSWNGAIFAAAGLERIHLRPEKSIDLDWMLPAPAQGAIAIACRNNDKNIFNACQLVNDEATQICTKAERDFLRALSGGCSTPISALAIIEKNTIIFKGNICSTDGKEIFEIKKESVVENNNNLGEIAGKELLKNIDVRRIIDEIKNAK
ncbi:MAG: hydroxymethylbilane synthase [Ginsengibacter sp.]